jgi:hypothetical protein
MAFVGSGARTIPDAVLSRIACARPLLAGIAATLGQTSGLRARRLEQILALAVMSGEVDFLSGQQCADLSVCIFGRPYGRW